MRSFLQKVGLVVLGMALLSGRTGEKGIVPLGASMTAAERLALLDSLAELWTDGIIPLWALSQQAPIEIVSQAAAAGEFTTSLECPASFELELPQPYLATRWDADRAVTEIYVRRNFPVPEVIRYDIDTALNVVETVIEIEIGTPRVVADLDRNGEVELVTQYSDMLRIHSAPDWILRASFGWPGMNVVMYPMAVNIDDDPYLEIYVTPGGLGGGAGAVIIKYDSTTGTFETISQIPAPWGAAGYSAATDFDEDGRIEFITGSISYGYSLFEWQETTLVYIGPVGEPASGTSYSAAAVWPKPDGTPHALIGHSSGLGLYRYDLLVPAGDNIFTTANVFSDETGWSGSHPCLGADTDCDGMDELAMGFGPYSSMWEWDAGAGEFVERCIWPYEMYGVPTQWNPVDLNQNGAPEWGAVNSLYVLHAFPDPSCVNCDSTGVCTPPGSECYCLCLADPVCDGVHDILDVVKAVDVAFRNGTSETDPFSQCPNERTDADCSGFTNVLDVVHLVNVAFRGGDPSLEFCDPCP